MGAALIILAELERYALMPKFESTGSHKFAWFFLAALIVAADQLTKAWIVADFPLGQGKVIADFFNLVHVHNYGAAFSFLSDAGGWQRWFFTVLSSIVSVVIVVWIVRLPRQRWLESLALALILGGALGNLYDRALLGYVVDFLDFHWSGRHFPAFNVADSGITVGAFLLILDTFVSNQDLKN